MGDCFSHTDSGGFEAQAETSKGAYEVHSRCLAVSFFSCHDFVRVPFTNGIVTHYEGDFHSDLGGFETRAEII